MSIEHEQADDFTYRLAREVMEAHHPELRMMGKDGPEYVRLCIFFAYDDDKPGESAVKCHGYPAAAVVSLIPAKARLDKRADAEIVIDRRNWEGLTETRQRALLDHEITHIEIQTDENGIVVSDYVGRPKLKLKLHDFDFGGFRSIARRYGEDAPEVQLARQFDQDFGEDVIRNPGVASHPVLR
jgi:hypothetical protein